MNTDVKEEVKDLVSKIQRELPDTDKDRYDVAYDRGRAQAQSGLMGGGLVLGLLVGAGLMWLFDPTRGSERRAQLASKASGLKQDLSRARDGFGAGDEQATGISRLPGMGRGKESMSAPLTPEELEKWGPAGPVAGAATRAAEERADRP